MLAMAMQSGETEPEQTGRPLPTYSPAKLKLLLRLLPHMHPSDSRVPLDREMAEIASNVGYRSWPSDSECDYLSLKWGLAWLAEREPRAELAVRLAYCIGMSTREIGQALHVSNATAWRWCDDGVNLLAWRLGFREKAESVHPFDSTEEG